MAMAIICSPASPAAGAVRPVRPSALGIGALAGLMVVAFFAVFGPVLWGEAARQADLTQLSAKPSVDHLLGTDAGGRDVLARVLTATQLSIVTALLSAALG